MAGTPFSNKRLQINKANTTMVGAIAISSFLLIFSLVACKALLSQRSYQIRVIAEKTKAKKQLGSNIQAVDSLESQYKSFVETPENVIAGSSTGTGERDGDNARIILDALPSQYDFPALTSSVEKILTGGGFKVESITGTDDEVNQQNASSEKPIEIPLEITVTGNYSQAQTFVSILERSIRPMKFNKLSFSGGNNDLQVTSGIVTYYQPTKTFDIKTKEVK